MKFKKWFQINEVQWLTLDEPTQINGIEVDKIDFRFEDWKSGLRRQGKSAPHMADYIWKPFSAPLQNGYLNFKQSKVARVAGNLLPAVEAEPQVEIITEKPLFQVLPDYWIDFAVFYRNDKVVKTPDLRRDYDSLNIASPEDTVKKSGPSKTFTLKGP